MGQALNVSKLSVVFVDVVVIVSSGVGVYYGMYYPSTQPPQEALPLLPKREHKLLVNVKKKITTVITVTNV